MVCAVARLLEIMGNLRQYPVTVQMLSVLSGIGYDKTVEVITALEPVLGYRVEGKQVYADGMTTDLRERGRAAERRPYTGDDVQIYALGGERIG